MSILKLLLLAAFVSFSLAACDSDDGDAQSAGAAMDKAGDKIGEAAADAGNAIEEAREELEEGLDSDTSGR